LSDRPNWSKPSGHDDDADRASSDDCDGSDDDDDNDDHDDHDQGDGQTKWEVVGGECEIRKEQPAMRRRHWGGGGAEGRGEGRGARRPGQARQGKASQASSVRLKLRVV
jgi:hypothetical protein